MAPIFGPAPMPLLQPHQDNLTRWDNHLGLVLQIQRFLNRRLTHREIRYVLLNGPPLFPPQNPYPLNPYLSRYINKLLLPTTMSEENYLDMFGVTINQFFRLRDLFVVPAIAVNVLRPYIGTADSVLSCFLLKFHKNIDDRFLGLLYGDQDKKNASKWFFLVLDHIYSNSQFVLRLRSLSQANHLRAQYEELHGSTMRQSRCA